MRKRSIALPTAMTERALMRSGAELVAGVDEVGRGAWAGPVSVGVAVVAMQSLRRLPKGVADSKLLRPDEREALFAPIAGAVVAHAIGHASPLECDELGMTAAQRLATERAFSALGVVPDAVVVDGKVDFTSATTVQTMVGADRLCVSVAAASVLAKVTRDSMMRALAPSYPQYCFERNKGYPSPEHKEALARHGLSDVHRASWSFAPAFNQRDGAEQRL